MARKRLDQEFPLDRTTIVDDVWLKRLLAVLESRIGGIENKAADFDEATRQLLIVGLQRVTETLLPALERVRDLTSLGFLIAGSTTPATLTLGATTVFTITAGAQRELFTPSTFVILTRDANTTDWAVLRTADYDRETGEYVGTMVSVAGNPGPHADWTLGALAGSTIAQMQFLELAEDKRVQTMTEADDRLEDMEAHHTDIILRHENIEDRHDAIIVLHDEVEADRTEVAQGLANYGRSWWGARNTPPPTGPGNAQIGAQYLDTAITPNAVKVLTSSGWAPTVTTSLGGLRNQDYALQAYAANTVFPVAGGFSAGDVLINGVAVRSGVDVTLTPGVGGSFTIPRAIAADESVSFRGYAANDVTDFYTKAETDARIAAAVQGLIEGAPGALDTLNELAAALGDDPNFATTVANAIASKVAKVASVDNRLVRFDGAEGQVQSNPAVSINDQGTIIIAPQTNDLFDWTRGGKRYALSITPDGHLYLYSYAKSGDVFGFSDTTGNFVFRGTFKDVRLGARYWHGGIGPGGYKDTYSDASTVVAGFTTEPAPSNEYNRLLVAFWEKPVQQRGADGNWYTVAQG